MRNWFLSTRAHSVGGPVSSAVTILDGDDPGYVGNLLPELLADIQGRKVLFIVHGYNVNQKAGIQHLGYWKAAMRLDQVHPNIVPIGILWPGDCFIPIFVDYVAEGHEAIASGDLLAAFLRDNFTGAMDVSFASHSLGARVVLQTALSIKGTLKISRAVLTAGALDNDCFTDEYQAVAGKIDQISFLASKKDDVLLMAYPAGNFLQGIVDRGHPYVHEALGREGPATTTFPGCQPNWQIIDGFDYGHLDYVPGQPVDPYPTDLDVPPLNYVGDYPPNTPAADQPHGWKGAFSAAFITTRLK